MQVGDVLFQVLQRVFNLQREQAAQARTVLGGRHFGLVEDFDRHRISRVDQAGVANQRLATLLDFQQLGQLAEAPCGVTLTRWRAGLYYIFNSCRRRHHLRWRLIFFKNRACHLQACQRLERTPRLRAQLGFECTQISTRAQLAAMLVHHAEVHEHMRAEHVGLDVGAGDVQRGGGAHQLQHRIDQSAVSKQLGRIQRFGHGAGGFGQRHQP